MPANLPPQYFEAEKVYRAAKTPQEKIEAIEEMMAIMPKHKGTDHLRAELTAKIAKLAQMSGKKAVIHRTTATIPREGAGQVVIVGLPNAGKSQLVCSVTNASPAVADYPFTTQIATPGMMVFENVKIQLVDTPPLAPQSMEFWFHILLRRADALVIMVDLGGDALAQMDGMISELEKMRVGVAGLEVKEGVILYPKKAVIAANKIDLPQAKQNYEVLVNKYQNKLPVVAISAKEKTGLDELKKKVYQMLDIIRVYTKVPGGKPDVDDPVVLKQGSTLEEAAGQIHKDFARRLKYARVWGSGKHDGIMVGRDHVMLDGDVVELNINRRA